MRRALFCFVLTLTLPVAAPAQTRAQTTAETRAQAHAQTQAQTPAQTGDQRGVWLPRSADAYAAFELDLSAIIAAQISAADSMDRVLVSAARHDPTDLSRGWIAYAALTAAQSPAFVQGLKARVAAAGRAPVLRQLLRDNTYARRRPPGSAAALTLVVNTMSADAARLSVGADRYDQLSDQLHLNAPFASPDDAQRRDRDQRLHAAIASPLPAAIAQRLNIGPLGAAPLTDANAFGGAHFWNTLAGLPSAPAAAMHMRADRQAVADRFLTLAGLFIIAAAPPSATRISALLDDPTSRDCLHVQQLEFRQCISVAHAPDEDAACLARHGLRDVQACLSF